MNDVGSENNQVLYHVTSKLLALSSFKAIFLFPLPAWHLFWGCPDQEQHEPGTATTTKRCKSSTYKFFTCPS